jgi:hypothetical protein
MCDENRPLRGSLTLNDVYNEDDAHNLKSHTVYVKKWIQQKKAKKSKKKDVPSKHDPKLKEII